MTPRLSSQPIILSYGFRVFFLAAGLYAVLAMAAWLGWLGIHYSNAVILKPTIAVAAHLWHGHEMLFGFGAAVVGGFLLTAVPEWTGTGRLQGTPLLGLAGLWLAGRLAVWFSSFLDPVVVMLVDMSYLPALAIAITIALLARPAPRNLVFVALLALLIFANGAVHAEWIGWSDATAAWGLSLGILIYTLMITVIGGRVVPAFTRNALKRDGIVEALPRSFKALDVATIGLTAALVLAYLVCVPDSVLAAISGSAALSHLLRLVFWRPQATLKEPLLWSLHLGYAFIPLGLAAIALTGITALGMTSAFHVLGIGAIGCMTLAIMSRAALGHTGRPLRAPGGMALSYALIAVAAVIRGSGTTIWPEAYYTVIFVAGGLWIAGFALFTGLYLTILTTPSEDTPSTV